MQDQGGQNPNMANPFANLPKLSKILAATLWVSFLCVWIYPDFFGNVFMLKPANTWGRGFIWNVFTAGFMEYTFFGTLINSIFTLLIGKTLEPIWGSKEFLRFVLIVNTFIGLCSCVTLTLLYLMIWDPNLVTTPLYGFTGILAAFTVAIKQLVPEQQLNCLFIFGFRAKHVPMVFLVMGTVFSLLAGMWTDIPLLGFGVYGAWLYLRFFQRKADGSKGDPSESFALYTFFPLIMQPFLSKVCNLFTKCVTKIGCCRSFYGQTASSSSSEVGSGISLGGGARGYSMLSSSDPFSTQSMSSSDGGRRLGDAPSAPPVAPPTNSGPIITRTAPAPAPDASEVEQRRALALRALEARGTAPPSSPENNV